MKNKMLCCHEWYYWASFFCFGELVGISMIYPFVPPNTPSRHPPKIMAEMLLYSSRLPHFGHYLAKNHVTEKVIKPK